MANLERETEEALGLPPRAKYTSTAVQDTADLLDKEIAEAESAGISQEPPTASDIANTVIDFTPVIGDIKGGVEGAEVIFEELGKDDPNFLLIGVVGGAGVVGLIPGVGDAAQKLIMQGARRFKKTELNPEVMEILTPKDQETVEILTKNTLPTPETDGERLADEVATMLREGKAGDLTDEMLETAGNDFHTRLTQNYIDGNVGMDLPMDWESTMARAADQGLTETRYHGSNYKNLPYFKGEGARRGAGMFNSDNVFKALTYEGKDGETYSLLMRPLPKDAPEVDVRGASWSNLDKPPAEFELDARGYKIRQIGPDPESGPVLQGASTLRREQRLDEFLPEQTGNLTTDSFMRKASELGYPGATVKNVEDVGASTPAGLPRDEAGIIRALAREPSQTQARTDTTGIRSVGARFDPRLTGLKNINMAQGGLTSMNDQTQMAFALGGEAETVDPVSGNDVPPGSLPEEVRDDIDAKLSEGEYVVPADVVRFFGVKFFEDLRTEAKMGLQQMDADGRIGGEPVQEQPQGQEDSMDVAELKAALSESGMYAGGLTDGGSLDTFIDDASRSPMVNGRMRASGATVKMAVGGLAIGNYGDVTKVDGIIQKLMTAANKDPALMEKLASKGIMVNKTGADKKSAEMKQANKPQEPIEAAEGVSVQSSPFDFGNYGTLGGGLFAAAGIKDPEKTITDTFLKPEGKIEQIVLVGPNGEEIPIAWNSAVPLEEFIKGSPELKGFTRKVITPTTTVSPVAVSTQDTRPRQTGDDSRVGPEPEPTTATPFDYRGATPEALANKYKQTQMYSNVGTIASVVAGPVGVIIGLAAKANHQVVKRRIEIELDRRVKAGEIKLEDPLADPKKGLETIEKFMDVVDTELSKAEQNKLDGDGSISGIATGVIRSFLDPTRTSVADVFYDKLAQNQADAIQEKLDAENPVDPNSGLLMTSGTIDPKAKTGLEKVTALKAAQDAADTRRFEKEEKERKEREAAAAAQAAYEATINRGRTAKGNISGGDGDNGGGSGSGGGTFNPSNPLASRSISPTPSVQPSKNTKTDSDKYGGRSGGYGGYTGSPGGRNTGGLVSIPATKKKKKQTTQRRKGLGTRP